MKKFTKVYESKTFLPDPSVIKKYASYIMPLYITQELTCQSNLLDEYLEMCKSTNTSKNRNVICELEILACKNIVENPLTQNGYNQLKTDIDNKCIKLEKFLKKYIGPLASSILIKKDFK
jgi:hypothetical protein